MSTEEQPRRVGGAAWAAVLAVVALGSSLVSLLFDLRPDLKRDPRSQLGADLSIFAVDPNVTQGQFLADAAISPTDLHRRIVQACEGKSSCGRLSIPGERLYVSTSVQGFKSRAVSMRLALYDAIEQARVPGVSSEVAQGRPDSPSDRSVVPVWIVCPPDSRRRYFVRVELYYRGDGTLLAVGDSRKFLPHC